MIEGTIVGTKLKGKVKWFNNTKGFGFIVGEGSDKDIFVHYSSVSEEGFRTLKEDQAVEYTLVQTERGLQASDVVKM